jgi:hypothetical protein
MNIYFFIYVVRIISSFNQEPGKYQNIFVHQLYTKLCQRNKIILLTLKPLVLQD